MPSGMKRFFVAKAVCALRSGPQEALPAQLLVPTFQRRTPPLPKGISQNHTDPAAACDDVAEDMDVAEAHVTGSGTSLWLQIKDCQSEMYGNVRR